jgi:hypothetical protein
MKPTVGRIVHVRRPLVDAEGAHATMICVMAFITHVEPVTLAVLPPGAVVFDVVQDALDDEWHWPEREE